MTWIINIRTVLRMLIVYRLRKSKRKHEKVGFRTDSWCATGCVVSPWLSKAFMEAIKKNSANGDGENGSEISRGG